MNTIARICISGILILAACNPETVRMIQDFEPVDGPEYVPPLDSDRLADYRARRDSIIQFYADQIPPDDLSRGGAYQIAARILMDQDPEWVSARLDSLLHEEIRGDMFWMFPNTTLLFLGRDKIPPETMARLRDQWRTYMPYRGDTENHWVLYYTTLYLMNEMYPEDPGSSWFTGKSSAENRKEAREFLIDWMHLATTIGQGEYDSPHYIKVYLAPMALLYGFAQDPEMKQRAELMLNYLLADYATESLNGLYGGAHSRIYPRESDEPYLSAAARFGWLLFGNIPAQMSGESFILAVSGFEPPQIIHDIANDRSKPFVHREVKRTRHRIRNTTVKNQTVYKQSYVRDGFVLGSSQGGLLQPIQQQTWSLLWNEEDPRGKHNRFTALHPYSDSFEGTMYFAEHWGIVTELIVRSKTTYDKPDKMTGGSPYEQVFQDKGALVALYDIPENDNNPHINAFFSKDLTNLTEDSKSGWIFAKGGPAFIAFHPMQKYRWETLDTGDRRWFSPHPGNGYVVQVAQEGDFSNFTAFMEAVKALPVTASTNPVPQVTFTSLSGDTIQMRYGSNPVVNGVAVNYDEWKLFDGPFLSADRNSQKLEMHYGPMHRLLDFKTLSITDWLETE